MFNIRKKITALTLSEMLVVLLLTVIVVGLAFSVLGLVQRQMGDIQNNYEEKTVDNLLLQSLWVDFNTHDRIEFSSKTGVLSFTNEINQKIYNFDNGYVISGLDTLSMDFNVSRTFYMGEEVGDGFIDALELQRVNAVPKTLFVFKRNAATDFMN